LPNKKKLSKTILAFYLIIALWSFANTLYFTGYNEVFFEKLVFIGIILFLLFFIYFILFIIESSYKKLRFFIYSSLLFSIILSILIFFNIKITLIFVFIIFLFILFHILFIIILKKGDIFFYILSSSFILSLIISIILFFIGHLISLKDICNFNNFLLLLNYLLINLLSYFPFFFAVAFLLQIRKFFLFNYIGGIWQNEILNKVEIPYLFIDSDDNILYANKTFYQISGFDYHKIKNKRLTDLLDLEKNILILSNNQKLPIKCEIFSLNLRYKVQKLVIIESLKQIIDIELKKENEKEFLEKYENFKVLFNNLFNYLPKVLIFIDSRGKIEDCNSKFEEVFKIQKEVIIGKSIINIFRQIGFIKDFEIDNNENLFEFIKKYKKEEIIINENFYLVQINELIKFDQENKLYLDDNENAFNINNNKNREDLNNRNKIYEDSIKENQKYLIIISDFTDVYKKRIELENDIKIFDNFIQNISLPICFSDPDGFIKFNNIKFSSCFNKFNGFNIFSLHKSIENILNKNFNKLLNNKVIHLGNFLIFDKNLKLNYRINSIKNFIKNNDYEKKVKNKFNNLEYKIYSIYSFSPFKNFIFSNSDNNIAEYAFIFEDITDRVIKERKLYQNLQNTKDISNKVDMLLDNINHEIRTPINIISGYLEILKYESHDEKINLKIDNIFNDKEKIQKMIDEMISINSFLNYEKDEVEFNLKSFLSDYQNYIGSKYKISFNYNYITKEDLYVKVNLMVFKKFFSFIAESYKNYDFLEILIFIDSSSLTLNKKYINLIIEITERKEKIESNKKYISNVMLKNYNFEFIRIVLNHLVFLLNGEIRFKTSSTYNCKIKIPLKLSKSPMI